MLPWVLPCAIAHAADQRPFAAGVPEYALKATFLLRLVDFIQWPAGPDGNGPDRFHICVFGTDRLDDYLSSLARGEEETEMLDVRRIESVKSAGDCHVVFFAARQSQRFAGLRASLCRLPVLTVADTPGFLDAGGMVSFITEGDRVTLHVNRRATEQAGLRISASLLDLAQLGGRPIRCQETKPAAKGERGEPALGSDLAAYFVCHGLPEPTLVAHR